jgi:uncharacterized coiled-coil protein SlyX
LREREGLIGRIRQIRRGAVGQEEPAMPARNVPGQNELGALEDRVAHLEQLVQGLQDSVHRESMRLEKRLTDVEMRIEPGAMGRALSDDARERGL